MPQMAPISWLSLFIIFSITLIIFNTLNYFSFFPSLKKETSKTPINYSMPWKW